MDDLISLLLQEHAQIQRALGELLEISQGAVSGEKIHALERMIISHVEKEEAEIYFPVKKLLKLSAKASELLASFRHRDKDIKILTIIFFEKYKDEKNEGLRKSFPGDIARLAETLRDHINFEEQELFPFLKDFWKKGRTA